MEEFMIILSGTEKYRKLEWISDSYKVNILHFSVIDSKLSTMNLDDCVCFVIDADIYKSSNLLMLIRILRKKYHAMKFIMFTNDFQIVNMFLFYYPIYFCQWGNVLQYKNILKNIIENHTSILRLFYYHTRGIEKCIEIKNILYFEKQLHKVRVKQMNGDCDEFVGSISEIMGMNYPHMFEINRSVIINDLYVDKIEDIYVILTNKERFEISRRRKKYLEEELNRLTTR
ncbi:MAG: LytTR family transcriptional regulator [Erysipelotrichaceae bacterium]|uniref:HTH LytTR-type domain-containing protein n=1 Tax=Copranaerobaculum intestinale TaxID=2692629 RepID=A0A6N8U6T3_9FIRM|nr:LytTR family DNA-binding domain-containing protein [Copranaerobaculum intestinale]MBS6373326.1 LytTR family transcriptional regulator [Erysipelotrichaceae bacterium]MXQ73601.1 hypothetical protein [Copranaerobaculum intestinale]